MNILLGKQPHKSKQVAGNTCRELPKSLSKVHINARKKGFSLGGRQEENIKKVLHENEILREEVKLLTTILQDALPSLNKL